MKLAIVVGHNSQKQGAFAIAPLSETEFEFNTEVAELMFELNQSKNIEIKIFFRSDELNYKEQIRSVYKEVDQWGADASMELHFNSVGEESVFGTEMLSSGSKGSLLLARLCQHEVLDLMDRGPEEGDRGIKVLDRTKRGGASLFAGRCPAILTEPFFGSNEEDVNRIDKVGAEGLAKSYLSAVEQYFIEYFN